MIEASLVLSKEQAKILCLALDVAIEEAEAPGADRVLWSSAAAARLNDRVLRHDTSNPLVMKDPEERAAAMSALNAVIATGGPYASMAESVRSLFQTSPPVKSVGDAVQNELPALVLTQGRVPELARAAWAGDEAAVFTALKAGDRFDPEWTLEAGSVPFLTALETLGRTSVLQLKNAADGLRPSRQEMQAMDERQFARCYELVSMGAPKPSARRPAR